MGNTINWVLEDTSTLNKKAKLIYIRCQVYDNKVSSPTSSIYQERISRQATVNACVVTYKYRVSRKQQQGGFRFIAHLGDTGGAADEHDLVHLGQLEVGVLHHLLDGAQRLLEQVDVQLFHEQRGETISQAGTKKRTQKETKGVELVYDMLSHSAS